MRVKHIHDILLRMATTHIADLPDEKNPTYALQVIDSDVLRMAVNGQIDLNKLAREELKSRGVALQ